MHGEAGGGSPGVIPNMHPNMLCAEGPALHGARPAPPPARQRGPRPWGACSAGWLDPQTHRFQEQVPQEKSLEERRQRQPAWPGGTGKVPLR